ncbi:Hypothetical predicted protein [Cloeon dipterum]|uniref:Uncharacterized protein n=1 Tax=Cloeon dipterum TaxID=197152 RepID=A0A8S1CPD3_9INSE|nr:Hypothetical predicted protein [Cloeon dipterum]
MESGDTTDLHFLVGPDSDEQHAANQLPSLECIGSKSHSPLPKMKFWIMLLMSLLVVSMIVTVYAKDDGEDDPNDSDASKDGDNSGSGDGDTSDSSEDSGANALYLMTMPVTLVTSWLAHKVLG